MTKFSGTKKPPAARQPGGVGADHRDADHPPTRVASAFVRDAESDLFLLAATNMVGEDTFYERAADRDARFVALVHQVTAVRTRRSSPVPTRRPVASVWPSTCARRCSCARRPS